MPLAYWLQISMSPIETSTGLSDCELHSVSIHLPAQPDVHLVPRSYKQRKSRQSTSSRSMVARLCIREDRQCDMPYLIDKVQKDTMNFYQALL